MNSTLKDLKKVLEKEIDMVSSKNDISSSELEKLDKAVDILKDIETICAMRGEYGQPEEDYGYSGRYPYYAREMSRTAPNYEASYRPGRDMMRYGGRDMDPYGYDRRSYGYDYGYSGHEDKDELRNQLMEKMNTAKTDKERTAIQTVLDMLKD